MQAIPIADERFWGFTASTLRRVPLLGRIVQKARDEAEAEAALVQEQQLSELRRKQLDTSDDVRLQAFVQGSSRAVVVEYRMSWDWDDDNLVDVRFHCPNCRQVLRVTPHLDHIGLRPVTCLHCEECDYGATIKTTETQLHAAVKQTIHRQRHARRLRRYL